jgi:hypothetical protein
MVIRLIYKPSQSAPKSTNLQHYRFSVSVDFYFRLE